MEKVRRSGTELAVLRRYFVTQLMLWTALVAAFLSWSLLRLRHENEEMARIQARHSVDKDLVYRRWVASRGGVYVPLSDQTPPNPYLAHIEERDITTPSGRDLTLVNPAYMTRQVHELGFEEYGIQGHMTSLNPLSKPGQISVRKPQSCSSGGTERCTAICQ
jgi:two-component system, cell cycle sensor histidine kinase and response regulator CckA